MFQFKEIINSLNPVFSVVVMSYILNLLLPSENREDGFEPSTYQVVGFVGISTVIGSIFLIFIFKKLRKIQVRQIYAVVLTLPSLILVVEIAFYMRINLVNSLAIIVITGFGITFFVTYYFGKPQLLVRNSGILMSSVVIGREFALTFSVYHILLIAGLFALFDLYSVFRGPLSKIFGKPRKVTLYMPSIEEINNQIEKICLRGTPVFISRSGTMLGIGDTLFYSMIFTSLMRLDSNLPFVLSVISISLGLIFTYYLLKRVSPLPALPIPISFVIISALPFL